MQKLPLISSFRVPSRWMVAGFFGASMLSAFGLDYFVDIARTKWVGFLKRMLKWLSIAVPIFAVVISLVLWRFSRNILSFFVDYFRENIYGSTSGLPLEYYERVIFVLFQQIRNVINPLTLGVFLPLVFLIVAFFVIKRFSRPLVASIVFLNFVLIFWGFHPTVNRTLIASGSEVSLYLQANEGRYLTFMPGFSEFQLLTIPHDPTLDDLVEFQNTILPPNFNLYHGLSSLDYYDNLQSENMTLFLAELGSDRATAGNKFSEKDISIEEKVTEFESKKSLLDFLGVRYVVSSYALDERKFEKVLETTATRFEIPVYIYKNNEARPLAYLVDKDNNISENEVDVLERSNGKWILRVELSSEKLLVISENNLPGWHVDVDDVERQIDALESFFIGIPLQSGIHEVILEYRY